MRRFLLFFLSLLPLAACAQVLFEARIDSMSVLVGAQRHITLDVTTDANANVQFPDIPQNHILVGDVEALELSPVDSTKLNDGKRLQCTRTLTVTSFSDRDTLYRIPPFTVIVNGEEVQSNALALKVFTIDVDTLHTERFYPIKDIIAPSLSWYEVRLAVYLGIVTFLLLVLGVVTFVFLRKGRPLFTIKIRRQRQLLPHQKAMIEMDRIKVDRHSIESGSKEYYTQLTDVLRNYISERFQFNAMEMTSSEIIEQLLAHDTSMVNELRTLFNTADMVKFAKASTEISENDRNLVNAIAYIQETKLEAPPVETVEKTELTDEQKSYNRQRHAMTVIMYVCLALVLIYLVYLALQLIAWFE